MQFLFLYLMTALRKLTIDDLDLHGKRVLLRVDFNVPLNENREITDDSRIRAAMSSIRKVLNSGGKAVLMSHLGRPKGKPSDSLRLLPVAERLSALLEQSVSMAPDCIGEEVENLVDSMNPGECVLLENLRFHAGETENSPEFANKLSRLADLYVNDAFGAAHRTHASTVGVTQFFEQCAAGFLLEKEIKYFSNVRESPKRPYIGVIGGAKISDKIEVLSHILEKVDSLLIGGGMMFTFLKAQGMEIGDAILEDDKVELAQNISSSSAGKLKLPVDCIIADSFSETARTNVVPVEKIPPGWRGMDIGPETLRIYYKAIIQAQTILWNGPMGVFEMKPFEEGTNSLAQYIVDATSDGTVSIIGGGDLAAAVVSAGLDDKFTHISTGGGASLEMLAGKELPGVAALTEK